MDDGDFSAWLGRTEQLRDRAGAKAANALAAMLGLEPALKSGDPLPHLWHWIYFLPLVPAGRIGSDGHPKRGDFLPPLPIERRMWAGGRLTFHAPIHIGDDLEKTSEIRKISVKEGRSGKMAFVTVGHTVRAGGHVAVEEEQDIVYLEMPKEFAPPAPVPLPEGLAWNEPWRVDTVSLFRFSAVTFNAHRIHYDLAYTKDVEKYPGLVVHGPLQAIWLLHNAHAKNPAREVASYSFRGVRPMFDFETKTVSGCLSADGIDLYSANGDGYICMQAAAAWKK